MGILKKGFTLTPKKLGVTCRRQGGFTLIELLIVIFIIALVSAILVINMRKGERQYQVQLEAQVIAQNIRRAQDMALSSFRYRNEIPYSYGVFFEKQSPSSYRIFADKNDNKRYDTPDSSVELVNIDQGVEIESISSEPRMHITFSLPDGFTSIIPSAGSATITIKKTGGNCPEDCKDIVIERTGRVSVQ